MQIAQLALSFDFTNLKVEKTRKNQEKCEFTNQLAERFNTSRKLLGIKTGSIPLHTLKVILGSSEESKNVKAAFYSKIMEWNKNHA